ncbi:MAG: hypothetical protein ACKOUT_02845 [Novosphingobium sp.]
MNGIGRSLRNMLLLSGALALASTASAERSASDGPARAFSAPVGPVILTRELRRPVGRSKLIITRRSYEIRFVREGKGWRVDGTLIGSEVEAPEGLAELAALEKARKDDGLFPLRLDSQGLIVAQQAPSDAVTTDKARVLASSAVEKINMTTADKAVARQMIQRIATQSQAAGGSWPVDLFRPPVEPVVDVREMPLPDGKQGRITVTMLASPGSDGQLHQLDRRVLTEIDGTSRLSTETWFMTPVR